VSRLTFSGQYTSPDNETVRSQLRINNYTLKKGDPLSVVRTVFFRKLDRKSHYTFRRRHFYCRISYRYFQAIEASGDATPFQEAYLRAVDEAEGNKEQRRSFVAREAFLYLFATNKAEFFAYNEQEDRYYKREMLRMKKRDCVVKQAMWDREFKVPYLKMLKQLDAYQKDTVTREMLVKLLEMEQFRFISTSDDPVMEWLDSVVNNKLMDRLRKPWVRGELKRLKWEKEQGALNIKAYWEFEERLEKMPKFLMKMVSSLNEDSIADMLSKLTIT